MLLGDLQRPADAPALLRAIRGGKHPHIHPGQALRAVLATVARRALEESQARHLHVGEIHSDLAAKTVDAAGTPIALSRLNLELLVKFAG
jgi:hypothetical protein